MSRGPGRWQQALLDATSVPGIDLVPVENVALDVLGRAPTRSDMVSVRRAAKTLVLAGKMQAVYLGYCRRCDVLSSIWSCPSCYRGVQQALVVGRVGSMDEILSAAPKLTATAATYPDLRPLRSVAAQPNWISVATAPKEVGGNT